MVRTQTTMAKLIYYGKVDEKGVLHLTDRLGFSDDLKVFIEKEVKVTVEDKRKRTLNQNGFYWSNFIPSQIEAFLERWGERYRKEQVHEWNKANFWGEEKVIEATGECIMTPASSADQSTVEFEVKLENIRMWFLQNFDWPLPYPKQQQQIEY